MKDKKLKYSPSTPSSMVPFEFTTGELAEHFPNVLGDYYGFALVENLKIARAYLCAEMLPDAVSLHIWIPPDKRSKETISWLKTLLHTEVQDWAKSMGCHTMLASCPYDLTKTKDLLDTFGFTLTPIWVGVIKLEETA